MTVAQKRSWGGHATPLDVKAAGTVTRQLSAYISGCSAVMFAAYVVALEPFAHCTTLPVRAIWCRPPLQRTHFVGVGWVVKLCDHFVRSPALPGAVFVL